MKKRNTCFSLRLERERDFIGRHNITILTADKDRASK